MQTPSERPSLWRLKPDRKYGKSRALRLLPVGLLSISLLPALAQADEPALSVYQLQGGLVYMQLDGTVEDLKLRLLRVREACGCEPKLTLSVSPEGYVSQCEEVPLSGNVDTALAYCAAARATAFPASNRASRLLLGFEKKRPRLSLRGPQCYLPGPPPDICAPDHPRGGSCLDADFDAMDAPIDRLYQTLKQTHPEAGGMLAMHFTITADGQAQGITFKTDDANDLSADFLDQLKAVVSAHNFGPASATAGFRHLFSFPAGPCSADQPRDQACLAAAFHELSAQKTPLLQQESHLPAVLSLIYTLDLSADGSVRSVQISADPSLRPELTDQLRQLVSQHNFGPAAAAGVYRYGITTGIANQAP